MKCPSSVEVPCVSPRDPFLKWLKKPCACTWRMRQKWLSGSGAVVREKTTWIYDQYTEYGVMRMAGSMPLNIKGSLNSIVSIILFIFK